MEHYCTLFDFRYLPQGMALHASLLKTAGDFTLWVLCMDKAVEEALLKLAPPNLRVISLKEIETPELLAVKPTRSAGEYCWTLTPFLPGFVLDQNPEIQRATYVDADCYFQSSPSRILAELDASGKDVLITPHDFIPEYDQSWIHGYYCVQFIPFSRTAGGRKVMRWWQERCLEWCYAKPDPGKRHGDQKYLDDWHERFASEVHVLRDCSLTLAPWNVGKYPMSSTTPCMFHFQGYRILSNSKCLANLGYGIPQDVFNRIHTPYNQSISDSMRQMRKLGLEPKHSALPSDLRSRWKRIKMRIKGRIRYMPLFGL